MNIGTVLTLHTKLSEIEKEWNSLEERNGRTAPLQSFAYTRTWYKQFSRPEAVRVFSVWSNGQCIGILPMEGNRAKGLTCFSSLRNEYSQHLPRIVLKGREHEFAECLLRDIADADSSWGMCKLAYLYSFDRVGVALEKVVASSRSGGCYTIYTQPTYCVDLGLGFEQYHQSYLSRNTRKNYRNKLSRIRKEFTMRTICLRGRDAAAELDTFLRMEDCGWKGDEKTSILRSSPESIAYFRECNEIFVEYDSLYLFFLLFNDTPAAGLYCYMDDGIMHAWKNGYENDLQEYSPSNILRINVIQQLAKHTPRIPLLHHFPKSYGYKLNYTRDEHSCSTLFLFRNTLKGRLLKAACILKKKRDSLIYEV